MSAPPVPRAAASPGGTRKSSAKSARSRAREFALQGLYQHFVGGSDVSVIDALMLRDAQQALAMANKAGLVQTGFSKVEAVAEAGRCKAVIEAIDGAEDGRRKIGQALRRAELARESDGLKPRRIPVVAIFAAADLELALGRPHVIHAALAPGPAAEGVLSRWRRLVRYRTDDTAASDQNDTEDTTEPAGPNAE